GAPVTGPLPQRSMPATCPCLCSKANLASDLRSERRCCAGEGSSTTRQSATPGHASTRASWTTWRRRCRCWTSGSASMRGTGSVGCRDHITVQGGEQLSEARASRPYMPGYGLLGPDEGTGLLPWPWAEERLTSSRNYWVVSLWPDGRPHAM